MTKNINSPFNDINGELLPYLTKIKNRINYGDYDSFLVVCGKERRGKSTLAAQIGHYMSKDGLKIENICMDMEEFLKSLKNSKKGGVLIFDEAGTNLYSREAMTTINRMLTKAFMVSGLKNVCIILCIPSFFSLDSYIRQHRLDLLFYVPKRGKFKVYSTKRSREISIKGAKFKKVDCVRANIKGWFTKQYPKYIEEEYRKKEIKFKTKFIKDVKSNIEGNYTTTKFCEITGYSLRTLQRWIKEGMIKYKKVGGRIFIPKPEAERVVRDNDKYAKKISSAVS